MGLELITRFHPPVEGIRRSGSETNGALFLYWLNPRWNRQSSTNLLNWLVPQAAASPWKPALS